MPRKSYDKPPFVTEDAGRDYVRKRGFPRKIRLRGERWSAEYMADYQAALAEIEGHEAERAASAAAHGSFAWLADQYAASAECRRLAEITQKRRRAVLTQIAAEPLAPGDHRQIGDLPAANMTSRAVKALRDRCVDKIEAGNFRVRALRALFKWALDAGLVDRNPARDVPLIRSASEGFATWTPEHVRMFEARWPIGTPQRLAMALLLFTGARRADAVALGRQH